MDFWLSLHAGGDFSGGVELAVDVEGDVGFDGEKGFDEGFLILLGGVCGEYKVGGVVGCVWEHFAVVLCGVHNDCGASFVCGEDGYVGDLFEVTDGLGFFVGHVGG